MLLSANIAAVEEWNRVGRPPNADALMRARMTMAANLGLPSSEALASAVGVLRAAEEACAADGTGGQLAHAVASVRGGYEQLQTLLSQPARDMGKLNKAKSAAEKRLKAAEAESDDVTLESKADRAAREARVAKSRAKVEKAQAAIEAAQQAEVLRAEAPPNLLGEPLAAVADQAALRRRFPGARVQVLSEGPRLLLVDGWLGQAGSAALGLLPDVLGRALRRAAVRCMPPPRHIAPP